jgi:hypothetical protein
VVDEYDFGTAFKYNMVDVNAEEEEEEESL